MNKRQVLVVEDDPAIRRGILDALQYAGYATLDAADGDAGFALALGAECDLLLLDLVLPKRNGFDVLRAVHEQRPMLPVIILTARGEEADRVHGLRLGADDYVVKPFSVHELLARVEAVLRRSPTRPTCDRSLRLGAGVVDLARAELRFDDGACIALSARETHLLRYLAGQAGRAVSRDELLTSVWGIDPVGVETRTVDMQIARLREKLRDNAEQPSILLTVRGKGYKLLLD